MGDLDFVLATIDPWLQKYIATGALALSDLEVLGVGVWLLEAEVNNGGFDQYFFNTRGALARATVESLQTIGATETASMLEAAIADVGDLPLPDDRDARINILKRVAAHRGFRALDAEYYEVRENRIGLLAEHLRRSLNAI